MMTILNRATDDHSGKASADYALDARTATIVEHTVLAGFLAGRRFRPRLWPTLAMMVLVPLFIAAGQWQWNKAAAKAELQTELDARAAQPALTVPATPLNAEAVRYRKLVARGVYEPQYQILIDNRTYRGQAGYHVVTPLRLEGSAMRVLINRGWVPVQADRNTLPSIATPSGVVEVAGTAIVPATRFFTLGNAAQDAPEVWSVVWQNLDLARYGRVASFPIQSVVMQLEPGSTADTDGLVREWTRPDDRRQTNLGYALQWWSFAATTVVLWLSLNFRKPT